MILFIFRLGAVLCLTALGVFFAIGEFGSRTVESNLKIAEQSYNKLVLQLEIDKNDSEQALSTLFRARSDFRDNEEDFLQKTKNLSSEIEGFTPKLEEIEKEKVQKSDELEKLEAQLITALSPLGEIEVQKKPLQERQKKLEEVKAEVFQRLQSLTKQTDEKANELQEFKIKRNIAKENFAGELNRLMEGIKRPFYQYYAESKKVVIASRAPSGKGVFINLGYDGGLREGMEFLARNESAPTTISFRLEATLVQKKFTFLGFSDQKQMIDPNFALEGQNLLITRSGEVIVDASNDVDESQISSEKK